MKKWGLVILFLLSLNFVFAQNCPEVSYVLKPHIMSWDENTESIKFETNFPVQSTLEYWTENNSKIIRRSFIDQTVHEYKLFELVPGKNYSYEIKINSDGQECDSNNFQASFKTSNDQEKNFRFAVLGDSRGLKCGEIGEAFEKIMKQIKEKNVDFVILLGDDIQADAGNCTNHKLYWQEYHEKMEDLRSTIPVISTPGNHENLDADKNARIAWRNYWMMPENGAGKNDEWSETVYSWRYGNSLFISLNTYESGHPGDVYGKQLEWFTQVLTEKNYDQKFVFSHIPIMGSLRPESMSVKNSEKAAILGKLMHENNVGAAFYGHDHFYCYNETKFGEDKLISIIAGGAGSPLNKKTNCRGFAYNDTYNYVIVDVNERNISGIAYNLNGEIIHEFSNQVTKKRDIPKSLMGFILLAIVFISLIVLIFRRKNGKKK